MRTSFLMLPLLILTSIINCNFLQDEERSRHKIFLEHVRNKSKSRCNNKNKNKDNTIHIYNADYTVSLLEKTIILPKNTEFYIEFIEENINEMNLYVEINVLSNDNDNDSDKYISFDDGNNRILEKIPNTNRTRILINGNTKDFKGEKEIKVVILLIPSNATRTIKFRIKEKNIKPKEYIGLFLYDINDPMLPTLLSNCKRSYLNRLI